MTNETKPVPQSSGKTDKDLQGEGNYDAARRYDEGTEKFVASHKSDIPKMGKDAEKAIDGPEGDDLRKAEDVGKSKARN